MRFTNPTALAFAVLAAAACDTTEPLQPARIVAHTATEQATVVATAAAVAPAVRVLTSAGEPVPGVEVSFAVTQGGGTIGTSAVRSDASGVAMAGTWTMGVASGAQEVVATAVALPGAAVTFRALAAPGAARDLLVITQPPAVVISGAAVTPQPAVRLADQYGNAVAAAGVVITAAVTGGGATVTNATAATDAQGVATFSGLAINGAPGAYSLQFSAPAISASSTSNAVMLVASAAPCTAPALAFALGEFRRYTLSSGTAPSCVRFDVAENSGQQYLLLFENMPLLGGYGTGLFPGAVGDTTLLLTLRLRPQTATAGVQAALRSLSAAAPPAHAHAWDFGAGPIYEHEPVIPHEGVAEPQLVRAGRMLELRSVAAPALGDTVVVRMEGIARLGISSGNQKAVIRHISAELIIAEDVRLTTTLARQSGAYNTPLSAALLDSIALEYAAIAHVQGDQLFQGRYNTAIEANSPPRVLAVHSLMYADNIWGYTYTTGDYFVWDYWVGTDGVTRGLSQTPQRVADNLIMHEIAHMRHWGLLQRNGSPPRGNRWLVEGFARHTERAAIANRLLGTVTPSRTDNVLLPRNPVFNNTYFRDDVPTFLNAGTSMFGGYQHASFVFDYFMDQVALAGGDYMSALRDLVINAGRQETVDAAVSRWLPGMSFAELFTRARIALYLDDIGTAGLPAWTQYQQFQLRASRPAGSASASDPRNLWPSFTPGITTDVEILVANGAAYGVILDGTQAASASAGITLDAPGATPNAVLSITRIR
ncbi:MAG TPA: hypothetical protein VMN60_02495 [Longimicrobiales bacterium]|nr:hypothetical protein [Longimicrobiales bacterium]